MEIYEMYEQGINNFLKRCLHHVKVHKILRRYTGIKKD